MFTILTDEFSVDSNRAPQRAHQQARQKIAQRVHRGRSPRAIAAAANAIDKAKFLVEEIDRRLAGS